MKICVKSNNKGKTKKIEKREEEIFSFPTSSTPMLISHLNLITTRTSSHLRKHPFSSYDDNKTELSEMMGVEFPKK